jgi:Zn-dependent protease with chaperone function
MTDNRYSPEEERRDTLAMKLFAAATLSTVATIGNLFLWAATHWPPVLFLGVGLCVLTTVLWVALTLLDR